MIKEMLAKPMELITTGGSILLVCIFIDLLVYYGGMYIYREFTGASKWEAMDKFRGAGKISAIAVGALLFWLFWG